MTEYIVNTISNTKSYISTEGPWSSKAIKEWEQEVNKDIEVYLEQHKGDQYDKEGYVLGTAPWPPDGDVC